MQAAALLGAGRIVLRNSGVRTLAPGVRTFAVDAPVVEERLAAVLASMNKAPAGALPAGSFVELGFSPLDILFPPWPYGYYGYGWFSPPPRMSLPEAIFSFVFGDGTRRRALYTVSLPILSDGTPAWWQRRSFREIWHCFSAAAFRSLGTSCWI